jgi:hypothetical protein
MLTLKQRAALEVVKFVGWAILCGVCMSIAITYVPFLYLVGIAVVFAFAYGCILMYEMFLARLEREAEQSYNLSKD